MTEFCLDSEMVIDLNRAITGTDFNVLDQAKLEGALAAPLRTWGGAYLVRDSFQRAGMLIERLANAHAFVDGNERTAWICGVAYLELLGFRLSTISDDEIVEVMVDVALSALDYKALARWLAQHQA